MKLSLIGVLFTLSFSEATDLGKDQRFREFDANNLETQHRNENFEQRRQRDLYRYEEKCPNASGKLDSAGDCAVFMLAETGRKEVIMTNENVGDDLLGDMCVAAGGELERSGNQIIKGDSRFEPLAKAPDDIDDFTTGTVYLEDDLSQKIEDALEASMSFTEYPCDVELESLPSILDLSQYGPGLVVFCINGDLNIDGDVQIAGDRKNSAIFNIDGNLESDGFEVRGKGRIKPRDIIWNVIGDNTVDLRGSQQHGELDGTIIAIRGQVRLSNTAINGQIISGSKITLADGSIVNCEEPAETPKPTEPDPTIGACCLVESGACIDTSEENCNGEFQGMGTTCAETSCPSPTSGACCLQNGDCVEFRDKDRCDKEEGEYQGDGSSCDDGICSTTGACCLPEDGNCVEVEGEECIDIGGIFEGVGSACPDTVCPIEPTPKPDPKTGACCLVEDGLCVDVDDETCFNEGGVFGGIDSDCDDEDICPTTGACCLLASGECIDVDDDECSNSEGEFKGFGTYCQDSDVCPTTGACCLIEDRDCIDVDHEECRNSGGEFNIFGTNCNDEDVCPTRIGACCLLASGECIDVDDDECSNSGGEFNGVGTDCQDSDICPTTGACCLLASGECIDVDDNECSNSGGEFNGYVTDCQDPGVCPTTGACCLIEDGDCIDVDDEECSNSGGEFNGFGTTCNDEDICPTTGACCLLASGECVDVNDEECSNSGGEFNGFGTDCQDSDVCPTTGACCLVEDGDCINVSDEECSNSEGEFGGYGTTCNDENICPSLGACCMPDGECVKVEEAGCDGLFAGVEVDCDDTKCPTPPGACCLPNGKCVMKKNEKRCDRRDGEYQGDGSSCDEGVCPAIGACCLFDGECIKVELEECNENQGVFEGVGITCAKARCPTPPGACCLPNGNCAMHKNQKRCDKRGGEYMGDGSSCDDGICPATGACCLPDGECSFLHVDECEESGGIFKGVDVDCEDAQCPTPPGACCLPNGSCVMKRNESRCDRRRGVYHGDGSSCDDITCPTTGACCLPDDGTCIEVDRADCRESRGVFEGVGVACSDTNCPSPDPTPKPDPGECQLSIEKFCSVAKPDDLDFECDKPIDSISMIWDGRHEPIRIVAYKGGRTTQKLADMSGIYRGDKVTVEGYMGAPSSVYWDIYSGSTKIGTSVFNLSCCDKDMNGPEDCGKRQGNGKYNRPGFINNWLLEGMVDSTSTLSCSGSGGDLSSECVANIRVLGRQQRRPNRELCVPTVSVEYTYIIKNTGPVIAESITVTDDKLGDIGYIDELLPNQEALLKKIAVLKETTTNIVTVRGTSDGGECGDESSATVTVTRTPAL